MEKSELTLRKLIKRKPVQKHVPYKYNLNHWLLQLEFSHDSAKKIYAIRTLASLCGVSIGTFNNWRYIKQGDTREILHSDIVKICRFLNKDINDFETIRSTENSLIKKK